MEEIQLMGRRKRGRPKGTGVVGRPRKDGADDRPLTELELRDGRTTVLDRPGVGGRTGATPTISRRLQVDLLLARLKKHHGPEPRYDIPIELLPVEKAGFLEDFDLAALALLRKDARY